MSWENIIKFDRNPYFDGESYVEQIKQIKKQIDEVIKLLKHQVGKHPDDRDFRITTVIDMLEKIDTEV